MKYKNEIKEEYDRERRKEVSASAVKTSLTAALFGVVGATLMGGLWLVVPASAPLIGGIVGSIGVVGVSVAACGFAIAATAWTGFKVLSALSALSELSLFSPSKDKKLDYEDHTNDKPFSNDPVFKPVFKPVLAPSQGLKATAAPTPQNKPESKPELKFDGVYVKQELKPELNNGVYEPKNGTHTPPMSLRY